MLIKQKSVRSAKKYLNAFELQSRIRLVLQVDAAKMDRAREIGFPESPADGDTILPRAIDPVTSFNAEGKSIPQKDLPKEKRYITTMEWSWEQWEGRGQTRTVTESRDVYKDCYQVEFIPPPAMELTWVRKNNLSFLVSPEFEVKTLNPDVLKHAINLFLAIFGECEIRKSDLSSFIFPQIRRLNWEFLPPGRTPWDRVHAHTRELVAQKHSRYSNIILQRQEVIVSHNPDEIFIGSGGFRSYVAYVFKGKRTVLLESVEFGNATYVFDEDWEEFSMLTKAEILNNSFQKDRLIHSKGWGQRLHAVLK